MSRRHLLAALLFSSLFGSQAFAQGSLVPDGFPAPTFKTLEQIESRTVITNLPFTINVPGSYYFTGNLTSETVNANGIIIDVDGVTLDLGGYELVGNPEGFGGDGILVLGLQTNIHVRNGTIRNWRDEGINGVNCSGSFFENLRILHNDTDGIIVNDGNLILNCLAGQNGNDGIDTDDGCVIKNCTAMNNGDNGIEGDDGCTIVDSAGYLNEGHGVEVGDGGTIRGCTGRDNDTYGIEANNGSSIYYSTADLNASNGIQVTQGCMVIGSSARNNSGHGFYAFSSDSLVRDCRADNNAFAGFYTRSADVRFDNNHSTDNRWGFLGEASGNFWTRNSASGNNMNYSIPATDAYGPIVNVSGAGDISGNPNANHPWANFEF